MHFSRVAVIFNPNAGRPRERQTVVERFAARLRQARLAVEICPTERSNHATDLAREAIARGYDLIVAHGGDGTMNEVLQAVVGTEATLAFWPGGTANVLAAELGFPSQMEDVVQRVLKGRVKRVTVGKANDRYFLLMAGIGLDAAVAAGVDPDLKKRLGKGAYAISALDFVRRWHLPTLRVELDGQEELVARFVVAGNAHSYGGGFKVTPHAELTEPLMDLCIFSAERRVDYVQFALATLFGAHLKMEGVTYRKVRKARILGAETGETHVHLDGEVTGTLPLTLEAVPEAVKLLV